MVKDESYYKERKAENVSVSSFRESQQWGGWGREKEGENFVDEKMKEPRRQGKKWTA